MSSNERKAGRRAMALLLAAWLVPLLAATALFATRRLADSWSPGPVPASCAALPFSFDDGEPDPLPPECEPGVPPRWVDVLDAVTRFTEELITLAAAVGLSMAVAVVVLSRRTRSVDASARLAFRLGVATLVVVLAGLVIGGLLLAAAVAAFPIRG